MTTQYTRSVLKLVIAQMCQAIGWHSVNSTPLEYMVDLMQEYIFQLAKVSQQYAQVLGRTEANLDDLGLAFRQLNIDLHELSDYVKNVDPVPCAISVPKLPISRENHLNFLKPGSQEVVTRPVHVFEHLPPMRPENEEEKQPEIKSDEAVESTSRDDSLELSEDDDSNDNNNIVTNPGVTNDESPIKTVPPIVFKRPGDPISFDGPVVKRAKTTENGRPLREIHSVIMTTSGYLSTAREGKLPEARTPHKERSQSPPAPPSPPHPSTSPLPTTSVDTPAVSQTPPGIVAPVITPPKKKKAKQKVVLTEDGKPENKENKKKKVPKETLFEPDQVNNVRVKKGSGGKEVKAKAKMNNKAISPNLAGPSNAVSPKPQGKVPGGSPKNLVKNPLHKIKSEMPNPAILPLVDVKEEVVDKLPVEPDKQKLNIFKKISSKPKEDKDRDILDPQQKLKNSRENSPSVILDNGERPVIVKQEDKRLFVQNSVVNSDTVKVSENSLPNMRSPGSDAYMYDMSPPRTPSTPKTPEINVSNVPTEQKKKKKDKSGKKKEGKVKILKNVISPKKIRLSNESMGDSNTVPDRPKTPQGPDQPQFRDPGLPPSMPFPFFPPFATAPGLIPPPMFPLMPRGMGPGMMGPARPAVMPPMLGPRFYRPRIDQPGRPALPPQSFESPLEPPPIYPPIKQQPLPMEQKPKSKKSLDNDLMAPPAPASFPEVLPAVAPMLNSAAAVPTPFAPISAAVVPAPLLPPNLPLDDKPTKFEKSEKKNKEHKKEKKDKMKKKKEKKEKHKEKGEKLKEKKDKGEKKDKLERLKEKKEKKEKRKEKEALKKAMEEKVTEVKMMEAVPKITLKLGPAGDSPRPATPDSALTKKITIKPPKKPDDEIIIKREPTPELARIAALVTRPPKQKSTSKKAQEGLVEAYATGGVGLSSDASFSLASSNSHVKKPIFKTLPQRDPPSPMSYFNNSHNYTAQQQERIKYCYTDPSGLTVWICPACGKQDDGSPMIGCDDCDAWYHWVCVGIQVAPADNEDWYCRMCIAKKEEQYHDKKKKKRKKKSA